MTQYRSRKDGSHYPISKIAKTGTKQKDTVHLGIPKKQQLKTYIVESLLSSRTTEVGAFDSDSAKEKAAKKFGISKNQVGIVGTKRN